MDTQELDTLARKLDSQVSRAGFLKAATGLTLGLLVSGKVVPPVDAKRRRKKKGKSTGNSATAVGSSPSTVTVTGRAVCGLSMTACSEVTITGNGLTKTTNPAGVNGTFSIYGVSPSKWYTFRIKWFSVAHRGMVCKNLQAWVGNPSAGTQYYIGAAYGGNTDSGVYRC
jgi:hypothetical protein